MKKLRSLFVGLYSSVRCLVSSSYRERVENAKKQAESLKIKEVEEFQAKVKEISEKENISWDDVFFIMERESCEYVVKHVSPDKILSLDLSPLYSISQEAKKFFYDERLEKAFKIVGYIAKNSWTDEVFRKVAEQFGNLRMSYRSHYFPSYKFEGVDEIKLLFGQEIPNFIPFPIYMTYKEKVLGFLLEEYSWADYFYYLNNANTGRDCSEFVQKRNNFKKIQSLRLIDLISICGFKKQLFWDHGSLQSGLFLFQKVIEFYYCDEILSNISEQYKEIQKLIEEKREAGWVGVDALEKAIAEHCPAILKLNHDYTMVE